MRDDARPRAGHAIGLVVAVAVLAVVAAGLVLVFVPLVPSWWVARTTLAGQSLLLAGPALVLALAAAASAVRSARRRTVWSVVAALAVAATVAGAVPAVAQARLAAREGVDVAWSGYLDGSAASPGRAPDVTTTFATPAGASLEADLYLPSDGATGGRPGVVLVHGGAWTSGTRSALPRWDAALAAAGAVVMDVEYRLSGPQLWRAQPADVACALGWLAARAARYGVDPARISVVGESAGGQAALLAGWDDGVTPSCPVRRVRPWRVVAIAAPTDLAALDRTRTASRVAAFGDVRALTGGPPSDAPQAYAAASPLTYAGRRGPSTLLVHGRSDEVVPVGQARAFARAATAAGGDVRLVEVPFADHAFDLAWGSPGTQVTRAVVLRFVAGPL